MTVIRSDTAPGRWRYAASLARLAARIILRPSFPVPTGRLTVRVPPGPRGAQVEALQDIADRLGVKETEGNGVLIAEIRVGCLTVGARLDADDLTRHLPALRGHDFDRLHAAAARWSAAQLPGRPA